MKAVDQPHQRLSRGEQDDIQNNTMKTHVYVFGAGASKAAVDAPLTNQFLERGFRGRCFGKSFRIAKRSLDDVADLVDWLYGSRLHDWVQKAGPKVTWTTHAAYVADAPIPTGVTIEDLLTFVDLAVAQKRRERDYAKLRRSLYDFIFLTLPLFGRPDDCYRRLVEQQVDWRCRNCFISFNYDTFFDCALWRAKPKQIPADYHLTYQSIADGWPQYKRMLSGGHMGVRTDLLKLHGSTNWARCESCGDLHLLPLGTAFETLSKMSCATRKCAARLSPLFIPPTFKKKLANYGMDLVWRKAEDLLSDADHITIIGYSFPDADVEARWLFKRSVAKGGRRPSLTIVDPSPAVHERITGFFGKTVSDVTDWPTFETYVTYAAATGRKMIKQITVRTKHRAELNITNRVRNAVKRSGVRDGICEIFSPNQQARIFDEKIDLGVVLNSSTQDYFRKLFVQDGNLELGSGPGIFVVDSNASAPRKFSVIIYAA